MPNQKKPRMANPLELLDGIAPGFQINGKLIAAEEMVGGLINTTYAATFERDTGETFRRVLQRINRHVFPDPKAVMRNVQRVTMHLVHRVPDHARALSLVPARNGDPWHEDENGEIWRCYRFIEDCVTFDVVQNTRQAFQAARAFGLFQELVDDLDASSLTVTIPYFHHTEKRYERLIRACKEDRAGRLPEVAEELAFITEREDLASCLQRQQASGSIPIRVTHNDTKISNVMMDAETDEAVCVIDLDTVMPGLAPHDFGDLVRTAVSPVGEDETDLGRVVVRMDIFASLAEGYISAAGNVLTKAELDSLVIASRVMAYEVAMRFLTDYLEGDAYFRITRPNHNLDRCRNQLTLLRRMEDAGRVMEDIVAKARERFC